MTDVGRLVVPPTASIRDAMLRIDADPAGVALVADGTGRLVGVVTDGGIRRAMLADLGLDLDAPVAELLKQEAQQDDGIPRPLTAPVGTDDTELLRLMTHYQVRQIPLVDHDGHAVGLAALGDLVKSYEPRLRALVMAGGYGRRLAPLTDDVPKPMLPVGDRPLLERIIGQLRDAGIHRVNVATHYRSEAITGHFGDGSGFGVEIEYVNEDEPLGTAGALGLVPSDGEPVLVVNGDILTSVDFRAMHAFHEEHHADLTVAVRAYEVRVPYGIVQTSGVEVVGVEEKPLVRAFVNAGMYLIAPALCRLVPQGKPYDMTDLIAAALENDLRVVSFPLRESWLDIGQLEDYERALAELSQGEGR